MENFTGFDPEAVDDEAQFPVGTVVAHKGKFLMYILADENIGANKWCVVNDFEDYTTEALDTTSDANVGFPVGVMEYALADTKYGWLTIYGTVEASCLVSCADQVPLYATATAGSADDAAGGVEIDGAVSLDTEPGTGTANLTVRLNFPVVRVLADAT
jgi:hypothetical protein